MGIRRMGIRPALLDGFPIRMTSIGMVSLLANRPIRPTTWELAR